MNAEEREQLIQDIERSERLRARIRETLARNEEIDLVEAWSEVERLDHDIVRRIRKRHPE